MKVPEPPLSASEIATMIYDSGHLRDRGNAQRLEQRITAYGAAKGTEAHTRALVQAVRKARSTLAGIRGANNQAAAARSVRAIESILPANAKGKEGYALGYKDGAEDALKKTRRDDTTPRPKKPTPQDRIFRTAGRRRALSHQDRLEPDYGARRPKRPCTIEFAGAISIIFLFTVSRQVAPLKCPFY